MPLFGRKDKTPELGLTFHKKKEADTSFFMLRIMNGVKDKEGGISVDMTLDQAAEFARTINTNIAGLSSRFNRR